MRRQPGSYKAYYRETSKTKCWLQPAKNIKFKQDFPKKFIVLPLASASGLKMMGIPEGFSPNLQKISAHPKDHGAKAQKLLNPISAG